MHAVAACGIAAAFSGQVPAGHRWAGPVRIADLDPPFQVSVQRDGSWLQRLFKGAREPLADFYITGVEIRDEEARFQVQRELKRPSARYEVRVAGPGLGTPVILPLGQQEHEDESDAEPISVHGDDVEDLLRLWSAIESDMHALRSHREHMRSATLRDVDVTQLDEPGELAEVILTTLAPIVREMLLRSRVPGELVLKRDLGNGRREELFVSRDALQEKFADLPYEQQLFFQSAGLGSEATVEFVHRAFPQTGMVLDSQPAPDDDAVTDLAPTKVHGSDFHSAPHGSAHGDGDHDSDVAA